MSIDGTRNGRGSVEGRRPERCRARHRHRRRPVRGRARHGDRSAGRSVARRSSSATSDPSRTTPTLADDRHRDDRGRRASTTSVRIVARRRRFGRSGRSSPRDGVAGRDRLVARTSRCAAVCEELTGLAGVRRPRRQGARPRRGMARCRAGPPELLHDHGVGIGGGRSRARRRSARRRVRVSPARSATSSSNPAAAAACAVRRGVSTPRRRALAIESITGPTAHRADLRDHAAHRACSSAERRRRCATRSTSRSWWSAARSPGTSRRRSSTRRRSALEEHAQLPYSRGARHHAVTPRRQRPADRCRRDGVARPPPRPSRSSLIGPRRTRSGSGLSRRRRGRSVRRGRSRSGAARRLRRRSRPPRSRCAKTRATSRPAGSIQPSQSTTRLKTRTWAEVQRERHLAGAAERIGRAGEAFGHPVDAGVGDEGGAERAGHVHEAPLERIGRQHAPLERRRRRTTRRCVATV